MTLTTNATTEAWARPATPGLPTTTGSPTTDRAAEPLPAEVSLVMSAMDAGRHVKSGTDRRSGARRPVRRAATLRLHADAQAGGPPTVVYTRDATGRNVGFLTRRRLPLGYGGTIDVPGPDGHVRPVACVVLRCSPAAGDWYDCCAAFNRLQPQFEA